LATGWKVFFAGTNALAYLSSVSEEKRSYNLDSQLPKNDSLSPEVALKMKEEILENVRKKRLLVHQLPGDGLINRVLLRY
jgi:hypothetical protein